MKTTNRIQISGPFDTLFKTAAGIAQWPGLLPHYRWVKILERRGDEVVAEMAARHRGVPLWWRTIQRVSRSEKRIYFSHIGGITKGMEVYWSFEQVGSNCLGPTWLVQIHHQFQPRWPPVVGPWFAERVVGKSFVQPVADKTLKTIKRAIEQPGFAEAAR